MITIDTLSFIGITVFVTICVQLIVAVLIHSIWEVAPESKDSERELYSKILIWTGVVPMVFSAFGLIILSLIK